MKTINGIFSYVLFVVFGSIVIEYFMKGSLLNYNWIKWVVIGAVIGIGKYAYQEFVGKKNKN